MTIPHGLSKESNFFTAKKWQKIAKNGEKWRGHSAQLRLSHQNFGRPRHGRPEIRVVKRNENTGDVGHRQALGKLRGNHPQSILENTVFLCFQGVYPLVKLT